MIHMLFEVLLSQNCFKQKITFSFWHFLAKFPVLLTIISIMFTCINTYFQANCRRQGKKRRLWFLWAHINDRLYTYTFSKQSATIVIVSFIQLTQIFIFRMNKKKIISAITIFVLVIFFFLLTYLFLEYCYYVDCSKTNRRNDALH